jgi:hypothetical protein
MFQRQLSTNALNINAQPMASSPSAATKQGPRLFQRQMTASQLFSGSGGNSSSTSGQQDSSNMKRLLASTRADVNLAGSAACLTTATNQSIAAGANATGNRMRPGDHSLELAPTKKAAKNKRIISRMLSISAIQTSVGSAASLSSGLGSGGSNLVTESGGTMAHNAISAGASGVFSSDDTNQSNDATSAGGIGEQQRRARDTPSSPGWKIGFHLYPAKSEPSFLASLERSLPQPFSPISNRSHGCIDHRLFGLYFRQEINLANV